MFYARKAGIALRGGIFFHFSSYFYLPGDNVYRTVMQFLLLASSYSKLKISDGACICHYAGAEAFAGVYSDLSGMDRVHALGDGADAVVGAAGPQLVLSVLDLLQSGVGVADQDLCVLPAGPPVMDTSENQTQSRPDCRAGAIY